MDRVLKSQSVREGQLGGGGNTRVLTWWCWWQRCTDLLSLGLGTLCDPDTGGKENPAVAKTSLVFDEPLI